MATSTTTTPILENVDKDTEDILTGKQEDVPFPVKDEKEMIIEEKPEVGAITTDDKQAEDVIVTESEKTQDTTIADAPVPKTGAASGTVEIKHEEKAVTEAMEGPEVTTIEADEAAIELIMDDSEKPSSQVVVSETPQDEAGKPVGEDVLVIVELTKDEMLKATIVEGEPAPETVVEATKEEIAKPVGEEVSEVAKDEEEKVTIVEDKPAPATVVETIKDEAEKPATESVIEATNDGPEKEAIVVETLAPQIEVEATKDEDASPPAVEVFEAAKDKEEKATITEDKAAAETLVEATEDETKKPASENVPAIVTLEATKDANEKPITVVDVEEKPVTEEVEKPSIATVKDGEEDKPAVEEVKDEPATEENKKAPIEAEEKPATEETEMSLTEAFKDGPATVVVECDPVEEVAVEVKEEPTIVKDSEPEITKLAEHVSPVVEDKPQEPVAIERSKSASEAEPEVTKYSSNLDVVEKVNEVATAVDAVESLAKNETVATAEVEDKEVKNEEKNDKTSTVEVLTEIAERSFQGDESSKDIEVINQKEQNVVEDLPTLVDTTNDNGVEVNVDQTTTEKPKDAKLDVNAEEPEEVVDEVKSDVPEAKNGDDVKTAGDLPTKDVTVKTKQSGNIMSKVKQSLVKVKKAIIGKSPSSKVLSPETKDELKAK